MSNLEGSATITSTSNGPRWLRPSVVVTPNQPNGLESASDVFVQPGEHRALLADCGGGRVKMW